MSPTPKAIRRSASSAAAGHAAGAAVAPATPARTRSARKRHDTADDPLWFKSALIYQLHVRSFCDSTGDGVGDFNGLISKLDYLADLGVTALWLQPFYPSPGRDDGYDIADYTDINPAYGRLEDFRRFIDEAHQRGLRVVTELVINHTSDQHAWFQRARNAPRGSRERDFYVWTDNPEKYKEARIIFKDFERSNWTYDPVAEQYFWHRFYSHQPDLNFENPAVQQQVFEVCDFWMKMGVDGVRLDAIPYLYEREGTSCENLPETHAFLRKLRSHVDKKWPGRMLLAEANQWPEDAVAYFGDGDECHMAFHFPVMPRLYMALRMEERFPIVDILDQTPQIPQSCQWAMFLRNHDELTLEMVTDEERDYMYRAYAADPRARINLGIRRRLAPLLSNNRRKIELMNALLCSMPGTPIMYYGDEIGMGDNVHLGDRNGVRTPMQWSADRNAGFSRANPQRLFLPAIIDPEYHYETLNVESQLSNPSSLLWWMKRLIALRKRYPVFGTGDIRFFQASNPRVLVFTRSDEDQTVLVVANLSRFVQPVEIPLEDFEGATPIEAFGNTSFPPIGKAPYFLSLGPHAFYWFTLQNGKPHHTEKPSPEPASEITAASIPDITIDCAWDKIWQSESLRRGLEKTLPATAPSRRWFVSKARGPRSAFLRERLRLPTIDGLPHGAALYIARFEFNTGEPESYSLPLMLREPRENSDEPTNPLQTPLARLTGPKGEKRDLVDALTHPQVARALHRLALTGGEVETGMTRLVGKPIGKPLKASALADIPVRMPRLEQSNTTVFFGEEHVLKLFRRLDDGESPEAEIGRHLTARINFPHTAPLAGVVEIQTPSAQPRTAAVVLEFVPSQGDAWTWMLDRATKVLECIAALPPDDERPRGLDAIVAATGDDAAHEISSIHTEAVDASRLLGVRTAELHAALGTDAGDAAFTPEPFSPIYQRSMLQSVRNMLRTAIAAANRGGNTLSDTARPLAEAFARSEPDLLHILAPLKDRTLSGARIRTHGDYHLGQVLHTGKDFIIIDFEGEPLRSIGERRIKRSPLRDVAGMMRSLDYAAWAAVDRVRQLIGDREGSLESLHEAAAAWSRNTSEAFTTNYFNRLRELKPELLGSDTTSQNLLLRAWLLEKTCYEILYEFNSRPTWAQIPLRAALSLASKPDHTATPGIAGLDP